MLLAQPQCSLSRSGSRAPSRNSSRNGSGGSNSSGKRRANSAGRSTRSVQGFPNNRGNGSPRLHPQQSRQSSSSSLSTSGFGKSSLSKGSTRTANAPNDGLGHASSRSDTEHASSSCRKRTHAYEMEQPESTSRHTGKISYRNWYEKEKDLKRSLTLRKPTG